MTGVGVDGEQSFLLDSLEDLERERAAGDISDEDYTRLRNRYTTRAATALRRAEQHRSSAAPTNDTPTDAVASGEKAAPPSSAGHRVRPRRRRRALVVGGALAVVAAVAIIVVVSTTSPRLPGQTVSGTVKLSAGQQLRETLDQAESLEGAGNDPGAVALYRQVLATDPTQPDALAQLGWLEFEAGAQAANSAVLSQAQSLEERAVRVAPAAYAPHLYLGSMLLAENNPSGAVTQFRAFLADHPPASQVDVARPFIIRAFTAEHLPLPTLPAAPTATTAPATTPSSTATR